MPHRSHTALTWTLLGCLIGLAGCGQKGLPPHANWIAHTSPDGRVSVKFPFTPKEQTETVQSALGKLEIKITMHESGNTAFMVSDLTYPVPPDQYDAKVGLEGAAEGAATNVNGTILSNDDIEGFGFAGKEIVIKAPQGLFIRGRIYIDPAGPTLFQAQCIGTRELIDGPDAKAFFDSLKIEPAPSA